MNHTPYVDFEQGEYQGHHISRLGCLLCNDTIGSKDPTTHQLYYWSHKRDLKLAMSDGSIAYAPVCEKCALVDVTAEIIARLDNTIKHGWLKEQSWALKKYPQRTTRSVLQVGRWAKKIFVVKGLN